MVQSLMQTLNPFAQIFISKNDMQKKKETITIVTCTDGNFWLLGSLFRQCLGRAAVLCK